MKCEKCGKDLGIMSYLSSEIFCKDCKNSKESGQTRENPLNDLLEILKEVASDPDSHINVEAFAVDGSNPNAGKELAKIIAVHKAKNHIHHFAAAFAQAVHTLLHAGHTLEEMAGEIRGVVEAETRFALKFLNLSDAKPNFEEVVELSLDAFYDNFSECNHGGRE